MRADDLPSGGSEQYREYARQRDAEFSAAWAASNERERQEIEGHRREPIRHGKPFVRTRTGGELMKDLRMLVPRSARMFQLMKR